VSVPESFACHSDTCCSNKTSVIPKMGGAKKNHVIQRALQEYAEPPGESEMICQARGSRGSNKIDVLLPDGLEALVILPAKFHKKIWIRKGSFVIVQVIQDEIDDKGSRTFNGEIVRVLLKDDEKHLRSLEGGKHWPELWCLPCDEDLDDLSCEDVIAATQGVDGLDGTEEDSSEEDLPAHLQRVSNRRRYQYQDDTSSDDD
jgi:probable RNA-binding protein EIF1AD